VNLKGISGASRRLYALGWRRWDRTSDLAMALSDIATVLRAVGGAAVRALFATEALFA
jgi:hypothetical protein